MTLSLHRTPTRGVVPQTHTHIFPMHTHCARVCACTHTHAFEALSWCFLSQIADEETGSGRQVSCLGSHGD